MKLRWTPHATSQLSNLYDHIAEDRPDAASKQVSRITQATHRLLKFPYLGQPGRIQGSRELAVPSTPYLIAYRIGDDSIQILGVQHGAQLWPGSFVH